MTKYGEAYSLYSTREKSITVSNRRVYDFTDTHEGGRFDDCGQVVEFYYEERSSDHATKFSIAMSESDKSKMPSPASIGSYPHKHNLTHLALSSQA